MNTDFLDEDSFTIRSLAKRYKVAYQTVESWVSQGLFNKPNQVTVYRLPGKNQGLRITQSGVDHFDATQIVIVAGQR